MSRELMCAFERARLPLKILDGPIQPRSPGNFQMDIYRSRSGEVRATVARRPGHPVRRDRHRCDFRQVVLRVAEPRRRYEEIRWRRWSERSRVEWPAARPHVADEVVRVDRREPWRGRERRHRDVYVRGRVTHPDHRDVHFDGWRRVVRNNAVVPVAPDRVRLRWID